MKEFSPIVETLYFQFLLGCYLFLGLMVAAAAWIIFQFLLGCYYNDGYEWKIIAGGTFNSFWDATHIDAELVDAIRNQLSIPFGMLL